MKAKRRNENQIMEEDSEALVRRILPRQWVMHTYKPDYGIDFVVEIFDELKDVRNFETSGEMIYVQLKAVQSIESSLVTKYSRKNVEKFNFDPNSKKDPREFAVVKFVIDVPLINTVMLMGNSIPVLLFVCDLSSNSVYFICLNDYAEKILYPEKPNFVNQETVTLEIPVSNVLKSRDDEGINILRIFGKRAKFYAAFTKFTYQRHELRYADDFKILKRFIDINSKYDFWHKPSIWRPIQIMPEKISLVDEILSDLIAREANGGPSFSYLMNESEWDMDEQDFHFYFDRFSEIMNLWDQLANLGNIHEEIVREWFLPTVLSEMCR